MSEATLPVAAEARDAASWWWVFLIFGAAWLLFAIILLRFDYTSVASISILFGCAMIAAAVVELIGVFVSSGWGRVGHGALAVACGVIGVVAFVHPGNTFRALAAILSFYLVIHGTFLVIVSLSVGRHQDLWWLSLITGLVELGIGLWAAGYWGRSSALLLAWIGITALLRGISEIIFAFSLRKVAHE